MVPTNNPASDGLQQGTSAGTLLPAIDIVSRSSHATDPLQTLMNSLNMSYIPPHPSRPTLQRGGEVKVELGYLHLDDDQTMTINAVYKANKQFKWVSDAIPTSQEVGKKVLGQQGIELRNLEDLGNCWSIRWSTPLGTGKQRRTLLQCQCGSSSSARKFKDDKRKLQRGEKVNEKEWMRKAPYDFTGCLAHLDLTYSIDSFIILRIVGILEHNSDCEKQEMQHLPAVPLHSHVWQIALQQINNGTTIGAVQENNRRLFQALLYDGQKSLDPKTANVRYIFLPQDSSRLYRMHARTQGVDLSQPAEQNINEWLDPKSPHYKAELAAAIFYYKARRTSSERFRICIHTDEMKSAAWKYAHDGQLILDGTFGLCDRRLLLFIGLTIDEAGKGVPIVFFLFSALTGTQATHAGYDTDILTELLGEWVRTMGKDKQGKLFCPKVAITDTDVKERGALLKIWSSIFLLLCKFHVRNAWSNRRKTLIKMGTNIDFSKQLVVSRLRSLDQRLISTEVFETARHIVQEEQEYLTRLTTDPDNAVATSASNGLIYLDYLSKNWLSQSLWKSWSHSGRLEAARILGKSVDHIAPTTNHLESFNGVLKRKYIRQFQKGGRRLRFDLLIFLLATHILPGFTIMATCTSSTVDVRLHKHQRYKLFLSCYGWGCCSCPSFSKYGSACKHLWAFRLVVIHMRTRYSFIFPQTKQEALSIYQTLFVPPVPTANTMAIPPALVEEAFRPIAPSNYASNLCFDTEDIIDSLGEIDVDTGCETDSEVPEDNQFLPHPEQESSSGEAAVWHQLSSRLSHEIQTILPRLHHIHLLLRQSGANITMTPELREFFDLTHSVNEFMPTSSAASEACSFPAKSH